MSSDSSALVPGLSSGAACTADPKLALAFDGAALDEAVRACTESIRGIEVVSALASVIRAAVAADQ